jgi:hypothetical protein
VPRDALFCTSCGAGSDRLTPPGVRHRLPIVLPLRLAALAVLVLLGWLILRLLGPHLATAWLLLCRWLLTAGKYVLIFWLLTGLLPRPWGARVRGAAWTLAKSVVRFVVNLFQ